MTLMHGCREAGRVREDQSLNFVLKKELAEMCAVAQVSEDRAPR